MVIKAQFFVKIECYFHPILLHKDVSKDIRENYKWIINLTPDPRIYAYIYIYIYIYIYKSALSRKCIWKCRVGIFQASMYGLM